MSLPPFGWWPIGLIGAALVFGGIAGRPAGGRLLAGFLAGIGQFFVSLAWALQFNTAGYVVLCIVESLFFALAALLVPRCSRYQGPPIAAFVFSFTLAEWARETWPFGGLPLGGAALGQVGGPLAMTARLGGSLLVASCVFLSGAVVGSFAGRHAGSKRGGRGLAEVVGFLVLLALVAGAFASPDGSGGGSGGASGSGSGSGPVRLLRAALVQGGGQRGLSQLEVPTSRVLRAALAETTRISQPVELILWPEDVVAENGPFRGSADERTLAGIARRYGATVMAGVTEPVGRTQFRNEIVAFAPSGRLVDVFEKVHRVPFGEYVPLRGFFKHLANLSAVPRDAIPGTGSGLMTTPAGRFAVLVSYEVFFPDRGRSGVRAGGQVVLVPTNTSSYSNDQAPSQEIAASRLQALEQGRYVLQVAPTGYSAVINNDGAVLQESGLSVPDVVYATVPELGGWTVFVRFGEGPVVVLGLVGLLAAWAVVFAVDGRVAGRGSAEG